MNGLGQRTGWIALRSTAILRGLGLGLMLAVSATPAPAAAPFVVADVATGRVLAAEDATMPWYPASVTKLMTTYVALKRLRAGAIGLETPIPVSRRAASAPPSKSGARTGQVITLDNALKILLVKSANDLAVVVAEGVGGSVEGFAAMMNAEAARLGMRESHFINPHGLHAVGQQTSARDMAILARALLLEFPEFAGYFQIGAVQLGARVMKNTNGLVGRYPGVEGMKTGFICASGFNLVAVASRNGQRLVAVVMGASSGAERTIRAGDLLDRGFSGSIGSIGWGGGTSLQALPVSTIAAAPNMREDICVRRRGAPASEEEAETVTVTTPMNAPGSDDTRYLMLSSQAISQPSTVRGGAGPRSLGPRALFTPEIVAFGPTSGSGTAPRAANAGGQRTLVAEPAEAPARRGRGKPATTSAFAADQAAEAAAGTAPLALPSAVTATQPNAKPLRAGAGIGTGAKSKPGNGPGQIAARPRPAQGLVIEPVPSLAAEAPAARNAPAQRPIGGVAPAGQPRTATRSSGAT
ncbi:MAG: D-alanyl-D-alanine carboxypeptidase family protein, partial [Alsobacter sp.]